MGDEDNSGEINFAEFVQFMCNMRDGEMSVQQQQHPQSQDGHWSPSLVQKGAGAGEGVGEGAGAGAAAGAGGICPLAVETGSMVTYDPLAEVTSQSLSAELPVTPKQPLARLRRVSAKYQAEGSAKVIPA